MPDPYSILSCFYYSNIFLSPQAKKRLPPWGKLRLSKKMCSPLGPLCEGAPPSGGGGENCAVARNISGYGKVLSLRPFGAPPSQREVFRHAVAMDLRVFFYRKFVVGQGTERSIAREFLEKMKKSKKKAPAWLYKECRGEHCSPANLVQQGFSGKALHIARGHGRAMLAPTEFYNGRMIYKQ